MSKRRRPRAGEAEMRKAVSPVETAMTAATAGGGRARGIAPVLLVVLATAIAYVPVLQNGFVDFDDQTNLVENPYFRGVNAETLRWMLTNLDGHYLPLTWLSFAFDYTLWGMNPAGYHLTSLVLHLANTVLFAFVSARLFRLAFGIRAGEEPRALIVAAAVSAALFALHPLRVESVAWATERRDVLSGLFILLAVGAYLDAHTGDRRGVAWRALGLYLLSLLAKPVGMSLPVVLVVLDVYPLRRLPARVREWWGAASRHVWLEKIPFLALAFAAAVVEVIAERNVDTFYSLAQHGLAGRIGQAFFALGFYLWKTVLPVGLSPLYQLPVGWGFARGDVFAATAFVVTTTVVLLRHRRRWPWGLAAWVAYGAFLAPVIGLAQAGPHIAADRYSYLATLGWAAVVGGGLFALAQAEGAGRVVHGRFAAMTAISAVVALALGALTWRQVGVWRDSITLWQAAVAAEPQCYICQGNLGNALLRGGRADEAAPHFAAAARIQPDDADVRANLGTAALREERTEEARRYFEEAIAIDPEHGVAHANLARLLIDSGHPEEAMPHLEAALRRDPMMAEAHTNLGIALMARGDLDGAARALAHALRIQPDSAIIHNNLGILALRREALTDAEREFRNAKRLDPSFPEAWFNLGFTLAELDRTAEAIAALEEAVRLRPAYFSAHQKLGQLLLAAGRAEEGIEHAAEAARLVPDGDTATVLALSYMEAGRHRDAIDVLRELLARDPQSFDAMGMLAWLLATAPEDDLRDGAAAVALAERAVAGQKHPDADLLDTLAAAYAEAGRFSEAVAAAERAHAAAIAEGNQEFAEEISTRIALYESGRVFRSE